VTVASPQDQFVATYQYPDLTLVDVLSVEQVAEVVFPVFNDETESLERLLEPCFLLLGGSIVYCIYTPTFLTSKCHLACKASITKYSSAPFSDN